MLRQALGLALATALLAATAHASPQPQDIQAPRGDDRVEAPRGQDTIQAPRGDDRVEAPRG